MKKKTYAEPLSTKAKARGGARSAKQKASNQCIIDEVGEIAPGGLRTIPTKREPILTRSDFNHEYIPLDSIQRNARRELLKQWIITHDPYVAKVLRWQENIETPYREAIASIYGNGAGWREALTVESRHDRRAKEELGFWLASVASEADQDEFAAFAKAISRVSFVDEMGPIHRKRLSAILFVLRCWTERRIVPTQAQVREFLKSTGFETEGYTRNNEARDFFTGPILGTLPKGKAGRKKLPSCRPKR